MDENASQSLLMVGGILLAISVLSFFVYAMASFGGFASNMNAQIGESEIQKHNQNFQKYESRYNITFQEIVSTINYAKDWNDQNDYSFDQVTNSNNDKKGQYVVNVNIIDAKGNVIQVFGKNANSLINEANYKDNQKIKNILNKMLNDSNYSDYYYAVNVKAIDILKKKENNYYVLNGQFGAKHGTIAKKDKDIGINSTTGLVEEIYFTAVSKSNYSNIDQFKVVNKQGKDVNVEYKVKDREYFRMAELEG